MGHRSWFYQLKSVEDLEETLKFLTNALEITGYGCFARLEVFFRVEDKLYIGWASDGSTAGNIFKRKIRKKGHHFGLLAEDRDRRINPDYLYKNGCYLKTPEALERLGLSPTPADLESWDKRLRAACSEDFRASLRGTP